MSIEAIGATAPAVAMDVELSTDSTKPIAPHSPPDSNNAVDVDGSDSELSDLDEVAGKLDGELQAELKAEFEAEPRVEPKAEPGAESQAEDDDIGEILPDHWSGTVPVFKPTMKQFEDFKRFVCRLAHRVFCTQTPHATANKMKCRWKKLTSMA